MATMPQPPKRSRLLLWFFISAGLIAIAVGAWNLFRSLQCERWPATEGVVQQAEMETHSGRRGSHSYSPSITYHYQVAGTNYTGNRWAFGAMSASAAYAQTILNAFPVGRKVSVRYSPDNPELAVLVTGIHGGTWIFLAVGTAFLLVGWIFQKLPSSNPPAPAKVSMHDVGQLISSRLAAIPAGQMKPRLLVPPKVMGLIFIGLGLLLLFIAPFRGLSASVLYISAGFFLFVGLCLILAGFFQNKL
jgi:hypothetical protein